MGATKTNPDKWYIEFHTNGEAHCEPIGCPRNSIMTRYWEQDGETIKIRTELSGRPVDGEEGTVDLETWPNLEMSGTGYIWSGKDKPGFHHWTWAAYLYSNSLFWSGSTK